MKDLLDLVSSLVLDTEQLWGEIATKWQLENMRAMLSGDHQYIYLTRPRGGSKTTDIAAASLAVLLLQLPARGRSFVFAASRDQAAITLDTMSGFVHRTPELRSHLEVQDKKIINRHTAATITVMPAESATAFGLKPNWLVLDEFVHFPNTRNSEQLWQAIFSSVPKIPGCRLTIISNAGDPQTIAGQVIEQARTDQAWYVHEQPGPLEWLDPQKLERQKRLLPEPVYRRLHLNEWTTGDDNLTTLENIQSLIQLDGPQPPRKGRRYRIGLDLGLVRDRTAASVSHLEDGIVILDRLEVWKGTRRRPVRLDTIEGWLETTSRNYNRAPIHFDPHQAAHLTQRLRSRGIKAYEHTFSLTSNHELATTLDQAIRTGSLHIYQHDELIDELATVRLKETGPNRFKIDTIGQGHDDMVIALALGVYAHQHHRKPRTLTTDEGRALAWSNASLSRPAPWSV